MSIRCVGIKSVFIYYISGQKLSPPLIHMYMYQMYVDVERKIQLYGTDL